MISHKNALLISEAYKKEHRSWIFRRKMDKSGYEVVRELDPDGPISEDNQEISPLPNDKALAEIAFEKMRDVACGRAAAEACRALGLL